MYARPQLEGDTVEIADTLRTISQEVWFAGWLADVEHHVWGWVLAPATAPKSARGHLPRLRELADRAQEWVRWSDEDRGVVPVAMDRWLRRHERWTVKRALR